MDALLALLPILVLLLCMIALRWTASSSGMIGAATAICVAILAFGYGTGGIALAGPLLEAVFTAAAILWIVFPALAIHEVQTRSGASARIGRWLATISDKPAVLVLILAWFLPSYWRALPGSVRRWP